MRGVARAAAPAARRLATMGIGLRFAAAWLVASATAAADADAAKEEVWPPVGVDTKGCRYGASVTDVKTIGWEGHHLYDIVLTLTMWEKNGKVAVNLADAGGLKVEPTNVAYAKVNPEDWGPSGFVLTLDEWSEDKVVNFRAQLSSEFLQERVSFFCSNWPAPPPPPSPLPSPPPPPSPLPHPPPSPLPPKPPPPQPPWPYPPQPPPPPPPSPPPAFGTPLEINLVVGALLLAVVAGGIMFAKNRLAKEHRKGGHMQRVHGDDDDTIGDDDDDEEDDDEEDDGDDDDEDGSGGEDKAGDVEGQTIKAFVALGDQVHSIVLPLDGIESWGALSQTIHEVCEDSDVPDLPVHGIMHIVLNVDGVTVPVTGKTPIDQLMDAKAIKVSITSEGDEEDDDDAEDDASRQPPTRQGN